MQVRVVVVQGLVVLTGPVIATAVGLWSYEHRWAKPAVHFGAAEAIAALTVLATVNVFTVQLSATRLPGPVARVAGQPRSIGIAYSAVLTVVAIALLEPVTMRASAASAWAAAAVAGMFSVALTVALLKFASRTDPAKAAHAYRSSTDAAHRSAGRYLGRLQAKAAETRDLAADLDGIALSVERERVGRRVSIIARRRGFLLPQLRQLRRLASTSPFITGAVQLRISAGIGTIVEHGEVVATILPSRDGVVDQKVERQVRRALRLRRVRGVDETTSAAVGLVALATKLAEAADFGTSRVVAQEAALIVAGHVEDARAARRRLLHRQLKATDREGEDALGRGAASAEAAERERDRAIAPVVPALRATTQAAVAQRLKGDRELFGVPELVLGTLLEASERSEATTSVLVFAIPDRAKDITVPPSDVGELLTMAAVRSMETGDTVALRLTSERLGALHEDVGMRGELAGVASVLSAICCWVLPSAAHEQFEWYLALTAHHPAVGSRAPLIGICRVGAASILSGLPSVALRASGALVDANPNLEQVRETVLGDETRLREEAHSAMRGRYLGDSPSDALKNFLDFVEDVSASL